MTLLNEMDLLIWPDSGLYRKAEPVTEFNEDITELVDVMKQLMEASQGVGFAAPQLGISKRVVVYKIEGEEGILINPEITWRSEEKQEMKEGCLSFPGVWITLERHKEVKVTYFDLQGEKQELHAQGFHAQMVQHELEHLDGEVFIQHVSGIKRDIVKRKMKKLKKRMGKFAKQQKVNNARLKSEEKRESTPEFEEGAMVAPTGGDSGLYDIPEYE